ncbi:hypothetical protein GHK77_08705 [Campylobacter jejuni]|nr:hypothetical protein [Campylobacter jejuni]EDP2938679.1 hypothetical protein [Campylobacter jejuni]EFB5611676.1 hypothetical protein [Campylobacter jejuni]EGF5817877.1 hypothetical protein [Campylobacter jejuni]
MKSEIQGLNDFDLQKEIDKKLNNLISSSNKRLEVGFFETAKYENGEHVANVAKIQEYGTLKIPARPFFRNAIAKNGAKWLTFMKNQFTSNQNLDLSLNQAGELARGDIVMSIMRTNTPPNSDATIKAKGSSKPLIDTGFMRNSVTFKVVKNG